MLASERSLSLATSDRVPILEFELKVVQDLQFQKNLVLGSCSANEPTYSSLVQTLNMFSNRNIHDQETRHEQAKPTVSILTLHGPIDKTQDQIIVCSITKTSNPPDTACQTTSNLTEIYSDKIR